MWTSRRRNGQSRSRAGGTRASPRRIRFQRPRVERDVGRVSSARAHRRVRIRSPAPAFEVENREAGQRPCREDGEAVNQNQVVALAQASVKAFTGALPVLKKARSTMATSTPNF